MICDLVLIQPDKVIYARISYMTDNYRCRVAEYYLLEDNTEEGALDQPPENMCGLLRVSMGTRKETVAGFFDKNTFVVESTSYLGFIPYLTPPSIS